MRWCKTIPIYNCNLSVTIYHWDSGKWHADKHKRQKGKENRADEKNKLYNPLLIDEQLITIL